MKNQKGFIQIPLLIVIVVGVLVLGGTGYFGVKQFQNYQTRKIDKEKETQIIAEAQQKTLDEAKSEIEVLKKQTAESNKRQKVLEQQVKIQKLSIEITAKELTPYLYGVVQIDCNSRFGSGTLWEVENNYFVLTNKHVIAESTYPAGYCLIPALNASGELGIYSIYPTQSKKWNSDTDIALLPLYDYDNDKRTDKTKLVYSISSLQKCPLIMHTGSPILIIGYPAYAQKGVVTQITTNGIISGFEPSTASLPNTNYFVSAKIDSGNSGGIAFSKDENGLCVLGIPTWLSVGNYETQGIVQNIHNVMNQP